MVNSNNQTWLNDLWTYIVNAPIDNFGNGYYGDVIKMYNMIIISGNYWVPQNAPLATKQNVFVKNEIRTYPNPSINNCTIKFILQNNSDVALMLTDSLGKIVFSQNYNGLTAGENSIDINLEKFNSGIYFCQISSGDNKVISKMIVK